MTPKPDDGDIVTQKKVAITIDDTARTLMDKMCSASIGNAGCDFTANEKRRYSEDTAG